MYKRKMFSKSIEDREDMQTKDLYSNLPNKEKEPKRNTKCSIPKEVDEFLDHIFDYLLDIVKDKEYEDED